MVPPIRTLSWVLFSLFTVKGTCAQAGNVTHPRSHSRIRMVETRPGGPRARLLSSLGTILPWQEEVFRLELLPFSAQLEVPKDGCEGGCLGTAGCCPISLCEAPFW